MSVGEENLMLLRVMEKTFHEMLKFVHQGSRKLWGSEEKPAKKRKIDETISNANVNE